MKFKLERKPFHRIYYAEESSGGKSLEELADSSRKSSAAGEFCYDILRCVGKGFSRVLGYFAPIIVATGIGTSLSSCKDKHKDMPQQSVFVTPTDIVTEPTTGVQQAANELLIPFEIGVDEATIKAIAENCGGTLVGYDSQSNIAQIRTTGSLTDLESALLTHPEVIAVPPNILFEDAADFPPNDLYWGSAGTWGFETNTFVPVWQRYGVGNASMFIFDGRFNPEHEDLKANVVFHSPIPPSLEGKKQNYHGNISAGLVGAVYNNTKGISGSGHKLKLLGIYGLVSEFVSRAKEAANDGNEPHIILLGRALNWPEPLPGNAYSILEKNSPLMRRVLSVYGRNTLFIMPAGNDNIEAKYGIGLLDEDKLWNVIVVGAHEQAYDPLPPHRRKFPSSNYGCDIYAAGEVMTSLDANGYVENCEGSCISAALVANAAGLIKSYYRQITGRELTARQIRELLLFHHGAYVPEWALAKEPPVLDVDAIFLDIESPYRNLLPGGLCDAEGWVSEELINSNIPGIASSEISGFASGNNEHLFFSTNNGSEHIWHLSYDGNSSSLEEIVSNCTSPVAAVDANGNIHLVYVNAGQIARKVKDAGTGSWSSEEIIGSGDKPKIAVYKNKIHVVFESANKVVHGCFDGAWNLTDVADNVPNAMPDIAVDELGDAHVIWKNGNDVYVRTKINNSWKLKRNVSNTPSTSPVKIAIGCNDVMKDIAIVWSENEAGNFKIYGAKDSYLAPSTFNIEKLADVANGNFVAARDLDGRSRLGCRSSVGDMILLDMGGVVLQKDIATNAILIRPHKVGSRMIYSNTTVSYRVEDSGGDTNIYRIHKYDR